MKAKLSVTLEENILKQLESELDSGRYRNKSHLIEFAVKKLMEQPDD